MSKVKYGVELAISNLLVGNPQIGFNILTLASSNHEIEEVRGLYLQAIQKAIHLGANFGYDTQDKLASYWINLEKLKNLVFPLFAMVGSSPSSSSSSSSSSSQGSGSESSFGLFSYFVSAVNDNNCSEIFISCILKIFSTKDILRILKILLLEELNKTEVLNTLFRLFLNIYIIIFLPILCYIIL